MEIKKAMDYFFERLKTKALEETMKLPVCEFNEKGKHIYFDEKINEDFIEWEPKPAEEIDMPEIDDEIEELYSTFYHAEFKGRIKQYHYKFAPVYDKEDSEREITKAFSLGKELFPKEDIYVIATASTEMFGGLYLCYNADDQMLFVYDPASDVRDRIRLTLNGFFYKLKPII